MGCYGVDLSICHPEGVKTTAMIMTTTTTMMVYGRRIINRLFSANNLTWERGWVVVKRTKGEKRGLGIGVLLLYSCNTRALRVFLYVTGGVGDA